MARRKKRFSYKKAMAASNRAIGRYHRLRRKNPKDKRYKAKRKTRSDKGGSRKRRRKGISKRVKSVGGKRRGPKKGYKQTKQHIAKRIASRRSGAGWKRRRAGRRRAA